MYHNQTVNEREAAFDAMHENLCKIKVILQRARETLERIERSMKEKAKEKR